MSSLGNTLLKGSIHRGVMQCHHHPTTMPHGITRKLSWEGRRGGARAFGQGTSIEMPALSAWSRNSGSNCSLIITANE